MIRANARLILYTSRITSRFNPRYSQAQKWLDNEVLKDSDQYVPMRTGNLVRSGQRGTKLGSGMVTYNAPYAARCYYGRFNVSKLKHPKATRLWFEKAKATCKDKWTNGVQKIMEG